VLNGRVAPGVSTFVAVPGRDDNGGAWLASYRRPLIGFVLPLVNGDVQAAEDVVQETMIRGWQHAEELRREQAGSWLHTVARNLAISSYHRRRRARPTEIPFDEVAVPAADDGLDGKIDAWIITAALRSLSPEHRVVIEELYYRQRSVAEVAALLAVPEGTIRSRCFYGLRALRKALEGQGITST
jgi:RNA polymerase sigma-70 factor, ECF subfamily